MKSQSPAQIYKSHLRGHTEDGSHRVYAIFNFDDFYSPDRKPFGQLLAVNDETLAPETTLKRKLHDKESIVIVPLVGAIEYIADNKKQAIIPGEAWIIPAAENNTISIKNPYDDELVNFLYIVFSAPLSASIPVVEIKLEEGNVLHPFAGNFGGVFCYMGIYDGRKEDVYKVKKAGHGLFVFVINGAFEVLGRLLEERDGLALWDVEEVDFEALSGNAILLIMEVPL